MGRSLSILLLVIGIGFFVFGSYVAYQVRRDENKIWQAEGYEQGYERPILGPVRRAARNSAEQSAHERIGQAKQNVARSQVTANWLRGVGIVVFAIGAAGLIPYYKKRR